MKYKSMKNRIFFFLGLLLASLGIMAQTDVTNQYLTNADFSTGWTTSDIGAGTISNVEGWSGSSSGETWYYGGAIGYASGVKVNSSTVNSNPDGTTSGGALGLSVGWGCTIRYTQGVTLAPGRYRISYKAYNANADATQAHNFIGFVEEGGITHYGVINNFIPNTWMEESITVELMEKTSGNISVGFGAVSGGSGANAKLFVDNVKIEAYNAAEAMMPGAAITPGEWTGNTGTYQNTYPEHYEGNHYTGDAMTSTTAVENGTYSADVYFHSHMAWISKVANDGALNAYITANDVTRQVGIVNNTGFAPYEPTLYHLDDIKVTDGNLIIKVGNSAEGGNWLTVKTEKITQMNVPYVSYGAFALPETAVSANYWYQVDVPLAGAYNLTVDGSATISYTQDALALTSATFNTTTGGNLDLTAGKLYLKSSASTAIALEAASYGYNIGDAILDKVFVQPGQTVTVTFPDANSNDPSANLTQDYSGVTLGGSELSVTTAAKGFTFTVPALDASGVYTLSIPANAIAYADHVGNVAQTLTLTTPAVFDGTYFLKNEAGQYLSRGADWGTRAIVDDWGLPIVVATDNEGNSTLKFADTGIYLYNSSYNAWCDGTDPTNNNTKWEFTLSDGKYRLSSLEQEGKFVKTDSGNEKIWTDGDTSVATNWTLEPTSEHPAKMAALRTAMTALSSQVDGLASKTYLTNQPTGVTEQYQRVISENPAPAAFSESIKVYPGIYKFSIAAFHRMGQNDATFSLHTDGADCPPMYAFFGDAKVQLKSVFDESRSSAYTNDWMNYEKDGKNYPNGVNAALIAFQEGKYQNTIWVRVIEETTIDYGIQYQGKSTTDGRWTIWSPDGIEITRYYDPKTDGLDEEDQLIESLRYTIGDVNEDDDVTIADVTSLVNIILGKQSDYRMEISDVNEDGAVTIADVTSLVNIILGKQEAKVVDNTWTYANINATIYAEQSSTENASGAGYAMNSAVCTLTGEDVRDKYTDIKEYLTTLNITISLSNVESVSVYAKGKENIAGLMDYNTITKTANYSAGDSPSVYASNDQANKNMYSDVITVTGKNVGTYVAYLLPVSLSNGVTVTVRDNNGKFYSQDFDITEGVVNNLAFTETTATNNWMATIPGNVNFSMLSTPGAHNAATSSCSSAAKCQSETIEGLLNNGVRAFDIRPGYTYSTAITVDNLYIYHGMVNTNVLYKDAVKAMVDFLQAHPSEAISVIMVKEDGTPLFSSWTDYTNEMCNAINEIHSTYTDYLKILDHSYYTLDDFRGKIFFGYRNAWDLHKTVRITNWPDGSSVTDYSVSVGGTSSASVEDAYNTSGNSKKDVVNALLNLASANSDRSHFHYTFTSVANSITSQANIQNPAAAQYISGTLTGPTGYVYADFMGSSSYSGQALLKAVIEQNYKYVFKGRSRVEQQ